MGGGVGGGPGRAAVLGGDLPGGPGEVCDADRCHQPRGAPLPHHGRHC